jgi:hypothetical protein
MADYSPAVDGHCWWKEEVEEANDEHPTMTMMTTADIQVELGWSEDMIHPSPVPRLDQDSAPQKHI